MDSRDIIKGNPTCNIIVSIPHGSSCITSEMKNNMRENVVLANNDWFLNELYDFLDLLNITRISANYSRYVIDVNRNIENQFSLGDYTKSLVYHKTTFNKEIYDKPLAKEIVKDRINKLYLPYHSSLLREINRILQKKDKVYLLDLHSFYIQSTADVVLGTREGKSCSNKFLDIVYNAFISEGFSVKVDEKGLRGGHIVSYYSSIENVESIQIELRYTTYIEDRYFGEEEVKSKDNILFMQTKSRLNKVFRQIKNDISLD